MPTTDVTVESSPATEAAPEYLSPEQMNAEQRNNWLLKGEIPLAGDTTEESPTSDEEVTEESAAGTQSGEPAPASQPVKSQEQKPPKQQQAPRKPKTAEDRKTELNREIQSLLTRKNQLQQEVETGVTRTSPPAPQTAQPATAAQPQQQAPAADLRPVPQQKADGTKWKSWNEYEEAKDSWLIREGARQSDRITQQRAQQAQQQQVAQTWRQRCDEASSDPEMPEFQKVAFNPQLSVNPATHQFIVRSPLGPKILFHLGQNPAVAAELAKCDPMTTASILGVLAYELGNRTVAAPGAKPAAGEKKPAAAAPKTKPSRTPDPAVDLAARNSAPADEEEAAVRNDDVRGFMEIQLRKDLAHRK